MIIFKVKNLNLLWSEGVQLDKTSTGIVNKNHVTQPSRKWYIGH